MLYKFRAKTLDGETVIGTRDEQSEKHLLLWMKTNALRPIDVQSSSIKSELSDAERNNYKKTFFRKKIKIKDKVVFFRQLSTMISAGISISVALNILELQTLNKRLKLIIKDISKSVISGNTLAISMETYPELFDMLIIGLVRSGEESGTLDISLEKLADFLDAQASLRKKIISALTYPGFVIFITFAVFGIMVTVVMPQFEKAFANLNVPMPLLTKNIFEFGKFIRTYWFVFPSLIIMLLFLVSYLKKYAAFRLFFDSFLLKLPVFGSIIYKASLSRSCRTMSTLLRSGVPILNALEMSGNVASNEKIKQAFISVKKSVSVGTSINFAMREHNVFEPMLFHMVAVGEETGKTDEMLEKISNWYDSELSETVKRLASILEPIMVVFVGIIVCIVVLLIFLPIISSIQSFL
ncbi:MAG: type II secretion system F family protein [Synergistaceae bacterium]